MNCHRRLTVWTIVVWAEEFEPDRLEKVSPSDLEGGSKNPTVESIELELMEYCHYISCDCAGH